MSAAGGGSLLATRFRSGLEESFHHGAVAVCDPDGSLIARCGDVDQPFYLRSAAKPFQAHVSHGLGADLTPLELAMASASHRGEPVHVALVEAMLTGVGLDESALGCPPDWPLRTDATRRLNVAGALLPRRIWHNCSGKHAAFLRVCVARGWPIDSYLEPTHPLQQQVIEVVSELGEHDARPVGVDGCGAPVLRTTARAMARLFARLAVDPALAEVFQAMHRYPALVACNGEPDSTIATAINAAAKGGAQGCIGVAVAGGPGIAVKSWDGLGDVAGSAAVEVLERLGALTATARRALEGIARPSVLGGGEPVGVTQPRVELQPA